MVAIAAAHAHLRIVLLGRGEAFHKGERVSGGEALGRIGIEPVRLSLKEGLALNNEHGADAGHGSAHWIVRKSCWLPQGWPQP